jgi:hypothetical protein
MIRKSVERNGVFVPEEGKHTKENLCDCSGDPAELEPESTRRIQVTF